MPGTENTGYLVQLQSPEGDNIVPIVSTEGLYDENGQKVDLSSMVPDAYTKAETLSSASATKLGLPASTLPADMFNVLAHAGDLHVWRRARRSEDVSEPGYNLSDTVSSGTNIVQGAINSTTPFGIDIQYADSVSVNDAGEASLVNPTAVTITFTGSTVTLSPEGISKTLQNKFVKIVSVADTSPAPTILYESENLIFCESNFNCSAYGNANPGYLITFRYFKEVLPYPAGVYTDYPVSVNPNVYQEGSDAKPAGYVVNDVIVKNMRLGDYENGYGLDWRYSDGVIVGNDGTLSLSEPTSQIISSGNLEAFEAIKGKFAFVRNLGSDFNPEEIYFFPSDANIITITTPNAYQTAGITKYQTVTGYPATPAGTAIEYLGKLGDKARIVTGTYVGTGTYGSTNQTTISLPAKPKFLSIIGGYGSENAQTAVFFNYGVVGGKKCGFSYPYNYGPISLTGLPVTSDGQDFTWYAQSASSQMNQGGVSYSYIAVL